MPAQQRGGFGSTFRPLARSIWSSMGGNGLNR
jgi:hypothetical protein